MFLLADDPHHIHMDMTYFYYFLVLAVILVVVTLVAGWKILTYLEHRRMSRERDVMADDAEKAIRASNQPRDDAWTK